MTPPTRPPPRIESGLRTTVLTLVLFAIFVVIPIVIGSNLSLATLDQYQRQEERRANRRAERRLDELVLGRAHGFLAAEPVRRMMLEMFSSMMISNHMKRIRDQLGTDTLFFLLEGRRLSCRDGPATVSTDLIVNTISAMRSPRHLSRPLARRLDPLLRRTFGQHVSLAWLRRNNGAFVPIRTPQGFGLAVFNAHADGQSTVFIIPSPPRHYALSFAVHRRQLVRQGRALGVAMPGIGVVDPPPGRSVTEMLLAATLAQRQAADWTDLGRFRWFFQRDRHGRVLSLALPVARFRGLVDRGRTAILVIALLLALAGAQLIWRIVSGTFAGPRSIRVQLWFLFAYVAMLPLAAALMLGWSVLRDRAEKLESTDLRTCRERLQIIEGYHNLARRSMLAYCRRLRNDPAVLSGDPARIDARMALARQDGFVGASYVLGDNARELHVHVFAPQLGKLLNSLVRSIVKRHLPARLSQAQRDSFDPVEIAIDDISTGESMGFSALLQFRDQVRSLYVTKSGFDAWWDVYPELATGPIAIMITRETGDLMGTYLGQKHQVLAADFPTHYLDIRPATILPTMPGRLGKALEGLMVLSWLNNRALQRELVIDGDTYWVVCMPDGIFNRFGLVCHRRAAESLAKLTPLRFALLLGLMASIALAWLAGRFLADLFLTPIADLTAGVRAIRDRRTGHRVPHRRADELGALAEVFNRTLADLGELEIAAIVQSSLFPATIPQPPGYEVVARSQSATDLGGDYYDARLLPDGRLLFLIGDATGHGASAALAMAVARTAFSYALARPSFDFGEIVSTINRVFFVDMRPSRKFMTMALALLDPHSNTLEIRNAAHNPSVLFRAATKTTEYFMLPGFILGMRARLGLGAKLIPLAPGDTQVFYTDGFTECPMADGSILDLPPFSAWIGEHAATGCTAGALCDALFARLEREREAGPLTDDVTLFIVRRKPEVPDELRIPSPIER